MTSNRLNSLGEIITAYIACQNTKGPLVIFGKPGIGKHEVIVSTLNSMCLRCNEVFWLSDSNENMISETDVAIVRSSSPDRARLDIGAAVSFMKRESVPTIVCCSIVCGEDIIASQFDGKIVPVICEQPFEDFIQWAASAMCWSEGKQRPRIHPFLMEFLRHHQEFFSKSRWHSPAVFEQISTDIWETADTVRRSIIENTGDEELAELVYEELRKV